MEQINNNKYTRIHLPSAYESIRSTNDEIKSGLICRQNGKRLLCLQEPRMSALVKNNSRNDLLNSKTTHFGNLEHDLLGKTPLPVRTRTHIKRDRIDKLRPKTTKFVIVWVWPCCSHAPVSACRVVFLEMRN